MKPVQNPRKPGHMQVGDLTFVDGIITEIDPESCNLCNMSQYENPWVCGGHKRRMENRGDFKCVFYVVGIGRKKYLTDRPNGTPLE